MIYIGLFEKSGIMAREFEAKGWRCLCLDIENDDRREGRIHYAKCDLSKPEDAECMIDCFKGGSHIVEFIAAFPPCDHLAVSGARWFRGKGLRALERSVANFATAADIFERYGAYGAKGFIENPVSTISTYWRKPDTTFDPCDYTVFEPRDNYTKKTCIWEMGGFKLPPTARDFSLGVPDARIHRAPPGPDRKDFRSRTPIGFSKAVAAQETTQ